MSTNTVNPQSLLVYHEMATPRVTPDGIVSWGGVAMNPPRAYPEVPKMVFDAPGIGYYSVNGPGPKGQIDIWLVVAAAGSARDVCSLVDASGTTEIKVEVDATNRPVVTVRDLTSASQALFVPSGAAFATGTRLHLRVSWNALEPINSPLYVDLLVNGAAATGAWTGGTSAWTAFVGAFLSVGGVGTTPYAATAFNGTIEAVQLGIL